MKINSLSKLSLIDRMDSKKKKNINRYEFENLTRKIIVSLLILIL